MTRKNSYGECDKIMSLIYTRIIIHCDITDYDYFMTFYEYNNIYCFNYEKYMNMTIINS